MKYYDIEKRGPNYYGLYQYRFYSLYNGTRGAWCHKKESAIDNGECHEQLIKTIHKVKTRKWTGGVVGPRPP